MSDSPVDPLIGSLVASQFRVERLLGQGGMGAVYLAEQVDMGRSVVLKVMHPGLSDAGLEDRFKREAKMIAQLNHPNIVQVHVFGKTSTDQWYFAMEYIDGGTLFQLMVDEGAMAEARALRIVDQVCSALAEAHAIGVIHRDLKPDNIMLTSRHGNADYVKVLDFGIAKMIDSKESRLTRTGSVFGTPQYMAPEQARGAPTDQRTDVYALGLILYEMVTGRSPFTVEYTMEYLTKHLTEPVIPPRERFDGLVMLPRTEAAILKCLAKSPEDRFQSVHELQRELRQCLRDRPDAIRHSPTPREGVTSVSPPTGESGTFMMDFDGPESAPSIVPPSTVPAPEPTMVTPAASVRSGSGVLITSVVAVAVVCVAAIWAVSSSIQPRERSSTAMPSSVEPTSAPEEGGSATAEPSVASTEGSPDAGSDPVNPVVVPAEPPPANPAPTPPVTAPSIPPVTKPEVTSSETTALAAHLGRVVITGDAAQVRFQNGSGGLEKPGDIPPGSYVIQATFGSDGPMHVGNLNLKPGQTVRLECLSKTLSCNSI